MKTRVISGRLGSLLRIARADLNRSPAVFLRKSDPSPTHGDPVVIRFGTRAPPGDVRIEKRSQSPSRLIPELLGRLTNCGIDLSAEGRTQPRCEATETLRLLPRRVFRPNALHAPPRGPPEGLPEDLDPLEVGAEQTEELIMVKLLVMKRVMPQFGGINRPIGR